MSPASTAQREPSMEEILASIRRIIEDSDGDKRSDEVTSTAMKPAANDVIGSSGDVEAFRGELGRSDAEAATVVRAQAVESTSVKAPESAAQIDVRPTPEAAATTATPQPFSEVRPAEAKLTEAVVADMDFDDAFSSLDLMVEPASETKLGGSPETVAKAPIISEIAGRQVAAAFGELSEAFAASRRRSFDEMAEEMLRPMLQDWLDNNLPHLVEKLVREEIERIARGT